MYAQAEWEGAWRHIWGMQSLECLSESFRRILWEEGFAGRHLGNRSLIIPGFVIGLNFILMEKERHCRVLSREAARSEMRLRKLSLPASRVGWGAAGGAHHLGGRPEV